MERLTLSHCSFLSSELLDTSASLTNMKPLQLDSLNLSEYQTHVQNVING